MISLLVPRLQRIMRLLLAVAVLASIPFFASTQPSAVTAMPMAHMSHTEATPHYPDCASYCARMTSTTPAREITAPDADEARTPDPDLYVLEPYFAQYLVLQTPRSLLPSDSFGTAPLRPPDILTLLAVNRR